MKNTTNESLVGYTFYILLFPFEAPVPVGVPVDFLPPPGSDPVSEIDDEYFLLFEDCTAAPLLAIGNVGGVSRPNQTQQKVTFLDGSIFLGALIKIKR